MSKEKFTVLRFVILKYYFQNHQRMICFVYPRRIRIHHISIYTYNKPNNKQCLRSKNIVIWFSLNSVISFSAKSLKNANTGVPRKVALRWLTSRRQSKERGCCHPFPPPATPRLSRWAEAEGGGCTDNPLKAEIGIPAVFYILLLIHVRSCAEPF